MEFIAEYGMFLLKAATVVVALVLAVAGIVATGQKGGHHSEGSIEIMSLNQRLEGMKEALEQVVLDPDQSKQEHKARKKKAKKDQAEAKKQAKKKAKDSSSEDQEEAKKKVYVLDFDGDIKASAVDNLREEISAILSIARPVDEVVIKLESGGGMVHSYGLAASQLRRIKDKELSLTVCVDKVAASGGYMMACIADKILAAPFAILGSVGVVAQVPNFHRLLKKHDVDYEIFTAGEYKRTLTMLGENTEKGRAKFNEDLEDTHTLFKDFVLENRPAVDIEAIATGEVWFGSRALQKKLCDSLGTSDQYLQDACNDADVYQVKWAHKKSLQDRLGLAAEGAVSRVFEKALSELRNSRYPS